MFLFSPKENIPFLSGGESCMVSEVSSEATATIILLTSPSFFLVVIKGEALMAGARRRHRGTLGALQVFDYTLATICSTWNVNAVQ